MTKEDRQSFTQISLCIMILFFSYFFKKPISLYISVISYIIISYKVYINAFHNLKKKELFDENFLMIISTIGAIIIGNNIEAVLVMLLYEIGEYLSDKATSRSEKIISDRMDLRIEEIEVEEKGIIPTKEAKVGDIFIVKPGARVPLDGIILKGESYLDTSSLTGESVPKKVRENDSILSGCLNKEGLLKVKATSTYQTSTSQRLLDLMKNAEEKKSTTETFIHRFAKIYTPIVCLLALLLVIIPLLLGQDYHIWIYRALVFLVTSCPCALVISVPLGYFCGIGRCAKEGIIVKGAKELESLSDIKYILLDKTGTITKGVFEVVKVESKEKDFLKIVASAEQHSSHPIATAIKKKYDGPLEKVTSYKEISGKGIECIIGKDKVLIGNHTLLEDNNITFPSINDMGTIIYVSINNKYQGYLIISDEIKESSKNLYKLDQEIIILSGDKDTLTKDVAKKIKLSTSFGDLLPEDKVRIVESYKEKGKTLFVGDGMNDAPVLKIADIGISMGGIGSDAAIESSDIIIMDDDLSKIEKAMSIAKKTNKKIKTSILFALLVKLIVLLLATIGYSTILLAVFADVGVTLLVILNVLTIFIKK